MKNISLRLLVYAALIFCTSIKAQQRLANIGDFITENGDTIYNCSIGYRTSGKLNNDSSNVIIYPTWFSGTTKHIQGLIGKNKLVDDSKFFIISIDALSNGVSSSPSNYNGPNPFPIITIRDMVKSQYVLLTENFGFGNIYGAIGGSMGGMQIFEWVTMFPGYINKSVSYVSTPKPTSHDLLQWNIRLEIIDSFWSLGAKDAQIRKLLDMQGSLMARSPDWTVENVDEDNFDDYLAEFNGKYSGNFTTENYRSQLKAMLSHNIYRHDEGSAIKTIEFLSSKMLIIVSETDHLVHPKNSIKFAELQNAELIILENNSGHLGVGAELDFCGSRIRDFFDK